MTTNKMIVGMTDKNTDITNVNTQKAPDFKFYTHHRNYWLNYLVIMYIFSGYGFSLFCITTDVWWLNLLGVCLLVHSLMWAAYFIHEFFHNNIFFRPSLNLAFGEIMLFLTGSCYSRFRDLAHHHIAHHIHRVDLSPFSPLSIVDFLRFLPKPVLKMIVFLELLYFPAVNLILRWMIALSPFLGQARRDECVRNTLLLLIRGSLFTALAICSPRAAILYFIAYICFLNITQFLECFQHTFPTFQIDDNIPKYSQEHEEANTYTIVLSRHWRWLDLLVFLNHNYHNAHHKLMTCPWYLLSKMDAEIYQVNSLQYISALKLFRNYFHFRYRIHRLLDGAGSVKQTEKGLDFNNFVGATGFSFMLLRTRFDWLNISSSKNSSTIFDSTP
ncbi:MAG: fatty acid desaturase (plasmid) [Nodularia sp. CChRGM 3473]